MVSLRKANLSFNSKPPDFSGTETLFEIDRGRVWEAVLEAVRSANSVSDFSGEDAQVVARFAMDRGASTTNFTVENFDLKESLAPWRKKISIEQLR